MCDDEGASHVRLAAMACLSLRGERLAAGMASSCAWRCTALDDPQPQTPRVYMRTHVQPIYSTCRHPRMSVLRVPVVSMHLPSLGRRASSAALLQRTRRTAISVRHHTYRSQPRPGPTCSMRPPPHHLSPCPAHSSRAIVSRTKPSQPLCLPIHSNPDATSRPSGTRYAVRGMRHPSAPNYLAGKPSRLHKARSPSGAPTPRRRTSSQPP